MSLTPAKDEVEARRLKEQIELCGKNRGPHDYIPIEWKLLNDLDVIGQCCHAQTKRVTRMLCRTCFCNVSVSTLIASYQDISRE